MAKPRTDADQAQQRRYCIVPRAHPLVRRRVQGYDDARDVQRSRGLRSQGESLDEIRLLSHRASCACGRHGQGHRLFYRRKQRLRRGRSVEGGIQLSSSMRRSVELVVCRSLPALFLSASLIACTTPARDDRIAAASPDLNVLTSLALIRIDQCSPFSAALSGVAHAAAIINYDVDSVGV